MIRLITVSSFLFQSSSGAQFTDYLHFNCQIYTFKPHLQREVELMFIYNLLWSESDFDFMYWSWSVSKMWLLLSMSLKYTNDESLLQVKNISRVVLSPYRLLICRFHLDNWLFSCDMILNISSHDLFITTELIHSELLCLSHSDQKLLHVYFGKTSVLPRVSIFKPGVVWIWVTTFDVRNEIFVNHWYDPNDSHENLLP